MSKRLYLAILLCVFSSVVYADSLRIAVAANFSSTLNQIAQKFNKTFHTHIIIVKGSTGKLYAQIKQGAPYDVFMAADKKRPYHLEQEQLIVRGSRRTYAIGRLALWLPQQQAVADESNKSAQRIHDSLLNGKFKRLAIANPKTAPYGQAAIEMLRHFHIYSKILPRLVYGENVAQAYQFVETGNADLGLVALSYVNDRRDQCWLPPMSSYSKLEQQLVILKSSKKQLLAHRFMQFVLSDPIKVLIRSRGYETP